MKIVFELVKTFEFDILSETGNIKGRIELFRNLENLEHFRYKTYEAEMFHLTPTFPQSDDGKPLHESDEMVWTEQTFPTGSEKKEEFTAIDLDEAIQFALSRIELFYKHIFP